MERLVYSIYARKNKRPNVQGGEDPRDTVSCRSFFAKELLLIGLFCGK